MQKASQPTQANSPAAATQALTAARVSEAQGSLAEHYSGNQAALRRLHRLSPRVHCKLEVGAVDDPLEAEADRVADQVMRMSDPDLSVSNSTAQISRKCAACEEEDEKKVHKKSNGRALAESVAPPSVDAAIQSSGQPLDAATRAFFEPRFGRAFGNVRVHTDAAAAHSARSINALAYAAGEHLAFAPGQYAPQTRQGKQLLAHELAHVAQQGAAEETVHASASSKPETEQAADKTVHPEVSRAKAYVVARQPPPPKTDDADATEEETPTDKFKGTPVSEIVISLARGRVGFRIPSGMLLGTASTDLPAGSYQLTAVVAEQKWNISGPGVKGGVRFSVDLSESKADPWTLSYPATLPLTVSPGMAEEPKTFGDMVDPNSGALKDPLSPYEGWGNAGPPQPVADVDDYETISIDKASVTPTADAPKPTAPVYRVKYRDGTEKTFVYAQLTDKMRKQLQPMFQKADEDFLMFTVQTFPMWWSVVSITPLAPMQGAGQRPYIPRRVPLAPPDAPPVNAAGGAGETPAVVPGAQGSTVDTPPAVKPATQQAAPAAAASNVFGGSGSTTETVELFHYGNLEGRSTVTSPTSYPRLTDCDIAVTQADAAKYTGAPVSPNLRYKYQISIDKAFFTQNFKNTGSRGGYSEYGTSQPIPVKYFQKVATLTGGSGGTPPPTTGTP